MFSFTRVVNAAESVVGTVDSGQESLERYVLSTNNVDPGFVATVNEYAAYFASIGNERGPCY